MGKTYTVIVKEIDRYGSITFYGVSETELYSLVMISADNGKSVTIELSSGGL